MHVIRPNLATGAHAQGSHKSYDAFISYAHHGDGQFAPVLQRALQRLGKPWNRRRAMEVYRDETSLPVSAGLWPSIQSALDTSHWLVLLASPEAAQSDAVGKEVTHWVSAKGSDRLLIVVTDGTWIWDDNSGDLSPYSTAVNPSLRGVFVTEPKYLDMTWARRDAGLTLRDPTFRDQIATLAAAIRETPKEEIEGEEVRQQRRTRRIVRTVITTQTVLILFVTALAVSFNMERVKATRQRDAAASTLLAAQSKALDASNPVLAAALAAAAWKINPSPEAQTSLLDVLAQPERGAVTVADGQVNDVAFSPNGTRFVTQSSPNNSSSGVVQIWDSATHHEVGKPFTIQQSFSSIIFNRKDQVIGFSPGLGGPNQVWNITTRQRIGAPFQIANDPISWGTLSPNGKLVATGSLTGEFSIINLATHRKISMAPQMADPLAFSRDGKLLAINNQDNKVRLLSLTTRSLVTSIPVPPNSNPVVAFSPNGKVIAVAGRNSVNFRDTSSGHFATASLPASAVSEISYNTNGKVLAAITSDGTELWDLASHQELGEPLPAGADVLAFSPDGTILATAEGPTVSFWDLALSRQVGSLIRGAAGPLAFAPNSKVFASEATRDMGLWNVTNHHEIGGPFVTDAASSAAEMAFSPNGKIFATGGADPQLWNIATHVQLLGPTPHAVGAGAAALTFTSDGKYLIYAENGQLSLWNPATSRPAKNTVIRGVSKPSAELFSPDGRILATVGTQVKLFSVDSRKQIGAPIDPGTSVINSVAFSPDGSIIAVATDNGATLWNTADQRQIGTAMGVGPVEAIAFSPDGMLLAAVDQDGLGLWNIASHEQVGSYLNVNLDVISAISFSPDGTILATSDDDQTTTALLGAVPTNDILNRVCAIAGGSMTRQQWNSYVSTEPYRQTCS